MLSHQSMWQRMRLLHGAVLVAALCCGLHKAAAKASTPAKVRPICVRLAMPGWPHQVLAQDFRGRQEMPHTLHARAHNSTMRSPLRPFWFLFTHHAQVC